MIRWIRRHPVLTACVLLCVLVGVPLAVRGTLNLTGFCWKEMRYVPMEEKFIAAMRDVYKYYPPKFHKISPYYRKDIKNPIKYKDFTDFVLRNPDCCRWTRWEVDKVSLLDRLMGYSPGTIRVEYAAYEDEPEARLKFLLEVKTAGLAPFGPKLINKSAPWKIRDIEKKYIKLSERVSDPEGFDKLLTSFRDDYRRLLQQLPESDRDKILAKYIFDRNYGIDSQKNSTFIHFDNCGNVWDPLYERYGLRYRR